MVRAILHTNRRALTVTAVLLVVALTWSSAAAEPAAMSPATEAQCEIIDNVVWTAAESPYVADCVVHVRAGGILTVESGTTVQFTERGGLSVDAGALKVMGTSPDDIEFTSAVTPPGPGDWRGIDVTDDGSGELHGLTIRYAGQGRPALTLSSITNTLGLENNTITDALIEESGDEAIRVEEVDAVIRDVTIRDSADHAVRISDSREKQIAIELTRVNFEDNEGSAVQSDADVQYHLDDNEARDNLVNAIAIGGTLSYSTTWQGGDLPFVLDGNITAEGNLTIEPNTVVKATRNASINATTGRLTADGTDEQPIYFTTITDDSACTSTKVDCDTENDGAGSQLPGSWSRITFGEQGEGGSVSNAEIRYGDDASIRVDRSSVTISNVLVMKADGDGMEVLDHSSTIADSRVIDSRSNGIFIKNGTEEAVTVTLRNNVFQDNGTDRDDAAVVVDADVNLVTSGNQTPDFSNKINGYLMSGNMTIPHTWLAGDLPFVVHGNLRLETRAAVLTLQPGLVVKFMRGATLSVTDGELRSGATTGEPVLLTSMNDDACSADQDTGCDTNGDRGNSDPTPGDWEGVYIDEDSLGAFIRNTVGRWGGNDTNGLIQLNHANSTIEDCEISRSEGAGIVVEQVATVIADNHLHHNQGDGIKIEAGTTPILVTLRDNLIESNEKGAIAMDANVELVLEGNNEANDNYRNGVTVTGSSRVTHRWRAGPEELPYIIVDDVAVIDQSTLTIDPGVIIKMDFGRSFGTSRGTLVMEGTEEQPIVVTSINDDSIGGDSNPQDGDVSPNAGNWKSIKFESSGGGGRLANVQLRYGGASNSGTIVIDLEGISITDSTIEMGNGPGVVMSDVEAEIMGTTVSEMSGPCIVSTAERGPIEPIFHDNTFTGCSAAIEIDADVQPDVANNSAEDNSVNGILVDGTLTAHRTWDSGDLIYVIGRKVAVGSGARLQIAGGTVVKAQPDAELDVNRGSLIIPAQDSPEERVVLTSIRDDRFADANGNEDTNGDGSLTEPGAGDWAGIRIGEYSNLVTVRNVELSYAGQTKAALHAVGGSIVIEDSSIGYSLSDGVSVDGTRATIRNCEFHDNEDGSGLDLDGESTVTVDGNVFVENFRSMTHQATGDVTTANNVAVGNEHDPMLYCADVTASQTWYNDLAREIDCDIDVTDGAELTIEPGAVLLMGEGESIRVADGLFGEGVAFAAPSPEAPPGFWDSISFGPNSRGFLRHSLLFFGGASSTGAVNVENSKSMQVAYNQLLRIDSTGISVKEDRANPVIEGNLIRQVEGRNAAAVKVEDESAPKIVRNRMAMADIGVDLDEPLAGSLVNYNNLEQIVATGVKNDSRQTCLDARSNWWGHSTGPLDENDDRRDACGSGIENLEGEGIAVSSNVNYSNWLTEPPPQAPLVDTPRCGLTSQSELVVSGSTSSNATVNVYDGENETPIRSEVAGQDGLFAIDVDLSPGEHRLSVDAGIDQLKSPRTGFRLIEVDPNLPVDPAGIEFRYGPGDTVRQPLRDEAGCATGCGGITSGRVMLPPGEEVVVRVPVTGSPSNVDFVQGETVHEFSPGSSGIWETGSFVPDQGPFSIRLTGGDDTECMGYIYPGGDGFVFGDTGVEGAPIIDHGFETADTPPLKDDMGWTGMSPWAVSDRRSHSPPYAWATSPEPDTNYPPSADITLSYTDYFNLREVESPTLTFWHYFHFARGDRGYVEGRAGAEGRWVELAEFEEVSAGWRATSIPLDEFSREPRFYLRFRFRSDKRDESEGWYIDDVRLVAGGELNGRFDEGEPLVEGSTVTLRQKNPDTGRWFQWSGGSTGQINPQQTDGAGRYGFFNLPPGEYKADVVPPSQSGFGPYSSPVLVVWNGTFAHNVPLARSAPMYLPWVANGGRLR